MALSSLHDVVLRLGLNAKNRDAESTKDQNWEVMQNGQLLIQSGQRPVEAHTRK